MKEVLLFCFCYLSLLFCLPTELSSETTIINLPIQTLYCTITSSSPQNEIQQEFKNLQEEYEKQIALDILDQERKVRERKEQEWRLKEKEYPIAAQTWKYFKEELKWNDYVCAGVMGNLMTETGGQTLNLRPKSFTGEYYGIIQWSINLYPSSLGMNLDEQLELLKNTVEQEINNFGYKYYKGFDYNKFISLENEEEVALAFAKTYERCSSSSYKIRQFNAIQAYDYFVE